MIVSGAQKSLLVLFIALLMSVLILRYQSTLLVKDRDLEDLALGAETKTFYAAVNDRLIHCRDFRDVADCVTGYRQSGIDDLIIWLGNSQLHAINQMKPDDQTAALIVNHEMMRKSTYVLTLSQPNANLQEHYVLYEYLTSILPVKTIVLPVVFDDMRENGIRENLQAAFESEVVVKTLDTTLIGKGLVSNYGDQDSAGNDMAALDGTVQDEVEAYLNDKFSEYSTVWNSRALFRGRIINSLYVFRNWVFGITPSSVRRMVPGRYVMNLQALEATLQSASDKSINVLLYIVPLRNDVKIPYDLNEYGRFKKDLSVMAKKYKVNFMNLEDLVPAEHWGKKDSTSIGGGAELDFMHFQAGGHKLLADELLKTLHKTEVSRVINNDF